jgi:hypothetical protein
MNTANHTARLALAALSALTGLAVSTQVAHAVTLDYSHATIATGPAGSMATNVAPDNGPAFFYAYRYYSQNPGTWCASTACVVDIYPTSLQAQNDSLAWNYGAKNAFFGPVVDTYTISGDTYTDHNNPKLMASTVGSYGVVFTDLVDASNTQFTLTFKGTSDEPKGTVGLAFTSKDVNSNQSLELSSSFTQSGTANWEMSIDLPVGYDLMGKSLGYVLSATNGKHYLSSMTITPHLLGAVPEASTLAMMGLGLLGLTAAQRRRTRH